MSNKEYRQYTFDIRTDDSTAGVGILTGVPIVFNASTDLGYYTEVIESDALNEADLRDVPFLVNHKQDMIPLARSRNNNSNSTMQMQVADDGMHIRVNLDTDNNSESKSLYSAVNRGDICGMSFAFTVSEDAWSGLDTDKPMRSIRKIERIFEVSAVTNPAYSQTSIMVSRSAADALDNAKAALDSAKEQAAAEERRKTLIDEIRTLCTCEVQKNENC